MLRSKPVKGQREGRAVRGQALTWPEHWEDPRVQTQQRALQVPGASRDHGGAAWGLWTQPDEDRRAERDQGPRESKQGAEDAGTSRRPRRQQAVPQRPWTAAWRAPETQGNRAASRGRCRP